jgi:hypothetical protein
MHKPTDEELNRVAAEVCGYSVFPDTQTIMPQAMSCIRQSDCPDYCNDRNALPELWEKVEEAAKIVRFFQVLAEDCMNSGPSMWHRFTTSPRKHVIAALKALDKWPDEWEVRE